MLESLCSNVKTTYTDLQLNCDFVFSVADPIIELQLYVHLIGWRPVKENSGSAYDVMPFPQNSFTDLEKTVAACSVFFGIPYFVISFVHIPIFQHFKLVCIT